MQNNNSEKKHFALKSTPYRPTFQQDMTAEERNVMNRHIAYWTGMAEKGIAIVFGPVLDPKGGYGLAVVEVENEEQLHNIISNDPAVIGRLLLTEFYPMRAVLPKK